ncbi:GNAT family N-acetyltransferase [Paractinoplanes ferrugineus]|uniref:Acetyltransferase n=1 Tax=Paractinoplanes ferrugineus TaxID=113564 RepID=A0A919JCR2_9ACTN|nr:GNAT family N-acetyltransferase [Actinoplanes ferrugineus]GIE14766.1 acetyltransferase [Actinoplanes ferrugineus]
MEREKIKAGELTLRPFEAEDIPWVYEVSLDPAVQRFLEIPNPYRMADAEYFVRKMAIAGWDDDSRAEFVIEDGAGERLGRVGFGLAGLGQGVAQIGYWLDPAARGRGVATAAVLMLCGWGFERLGLELIEWRAEVGNVASRRVAEKAGFRLEATLRQRLRHRGVRVDAWIGSMLPAELPTRPG